MSEKDTEEFTQEEAKKYGAFEDDALLEEKEIEGEKNNDENR